MRVARRRRGLAITAALILGLTTAACGGGGHGGATTTTSTRTHHAPLSPEHRLAVLMVLRHHDLPGFVPANFQPSRTAMGLADKLARCSGGIGPGQAVAYVRSRDFDRGNKLNAQQVSSHVEVLSSSQAVRRDIAAARSRRGRRCLERYVRRLLNLQGSRQLAFGSVRLHALAPPHGRQSFGFRFDLTAEGAGLRLRFYVVVLGFGIAREEVELSTLSLGHQFPPGLQRRLFGVLLKRAQKHH